MPIRPTPASPSSRTDTRGGRLAAALDLDLDPSSPRPRRALEVYPHAASVALFRLGRTLKYKDKKGRKFEKMQSELLRLMTLIEGLKDADVPLRVAQHDDWQQSPPFGRNRNAQERIAAGRGSGRRRAVRLRRALLRPSTRRCHRVRRSRNRVHPHADAPAGADSATGRTDSGRCTYGVADYEARRPALVAATENYLRLVTALLDDAGINYLSITARTKSVESFAAKAERAVDGRRLFSDPLVEITDQVGLRVITYLREDVDAVATLLADEMRLLDDRDMGLETAREGRWGYASRHLLVGVEGEQQPASIQVRTVLQHAWAEFEHDIRYKGSIPAEHAPDLDRRFTLAAGLLELADREFTAIRERLRVTMTGDETTDEETEASTDPRIATPVLATYLGNRYADAGWSRTDHYGWISGLLLELGITSLDELTSVLDTVDAGAINRAMGYRYPAGAVRRLDDALLAVFGDRYLRLHGNAHRVGLLADRLKRLRNGDG